MRYPIVFRNSIVPRLASIFINVYAITLFPFVFIRDEGNEVTLNHETIHIKQQGELWVIFFYLLYVTDWLWGLIKYRNLDAAYQRIRFEQEAYDNEEDWVYVLNRKKFAWRNYKV